jgi:type 1 glutamine amidotransferase
MIAPAAYDSIPHHRQQLKFPDMADAVEKGLEWAGER